MVVTGPPAVIQFPPPIAHAAAGCIGSALSLLLFYPLERARIELQAHAPDDDHVSCTLHTHSNDDSIQTLGAADKQSWKHRKNSIISCLVRLRLKRQLYRGVQPVVATLALSNFIFFYALQACKQLFSMRFNFSSDSAYHALMATSLAGIINVLLTNPFWVVNLRLVQGEDTDPDSLHRKRGFFDTLKDITNNEGIGQLWSGTGASLLLVSNPAIQLFIYEQGKYSLLLQQKTLSFLSPFRLENRLDFSNNLNAMEAFFLGAFSKGIATIITYPLQLAQVVVRLQKESRLSSDRKLTTQNTDHQYQTLVSQHARRFRGTWDCLFKLYRKGGMQALYTGMDAKLLLNILSAAFTFLTYEQILMLITRGRFLQIGS